MTSLHLRGALRLLRPALLMLAVLLVVPQAACASDYAPTAVITLDPLRPNFLLYHGEAVVFDLLGIRSVARSRQIHM